MYMLPERRHNMHGTMKYQSPIYGMSCNFESPIYVKSERLNCNGCGNSFFVVC